MTGFAVGFLVSILVQHFYTKQFLDRGEVGKFLLLTSAISLLITVAILYLLY